MQGNADYGDYIDRLLDSTVVLKRLAASERNPNQDLLAIADRLQVIANDFLTAQATHQTQSS